jgi:hypothetical protein
LTFLLINRGNNENSLNLKVKKSDINKNNGNNTLDNNENSLNLKVKKSDINILDKKNIYIIGLIETVLNTYNSKYNWEDNSNNLLYVFYLFPENFNNLTDKRILNFITLAEKDIYNNKNKKSLFENYIDKNKSNDIKNHNLNLKMPSLTEMLIEKAYVIGIENQNVIRRSNYKYTPLINTAFNTNSNNYKMDFFINWLVVSRLLAHEFNILVPAFKYSLYRNDKNNIMNNNNNKLAYNLWQIRQMSTYFEGTSHLIDKKAEVYIKDLLSFELMDREIFEDLLYICLHLLLANSIIQHLNKLGNFENTNESDFFKEIFFIVEKHNKDYAEGYTILNNLRINGVNYHYSNEQLKMIYKNSS